MPDGSSQMTDGTTSAAPVPRRAAGLAVARDSTPADDSRGRPFRVAMNRAGVPALRLAAVVFPLLFMAVAAATYPIFADPATIGSDSSNYYAAGLRLNAGHPLYRLSPGDRDVPLAPPYWSIPLLAPPPIAVLWRGLAAMGDVAMNLWWAASIAALALTVAIAVRRGTPAALPVMIALSPAVALTAVSANANAFLIPLLMACWFLRDRAPIAAGVFVALAAAVKLSPILLAGWFLLRPSPAGRRGLLGAAGGGLAIGIVSLVGAGLGAHLDYVAAFRSAANGAPTPLSVPGLLLGTGAPDAVVALSLPLLVVVALAGAFLVRRDDGRSFALIALAAALATPVVYFQTIALLAVPLAPWLLAAPRSSTSTPRPIVGRLAAVGGPG